MLIKLAKDKTDQMHLATLKPPPDTSRGIRPRRTS
jgi:hypothetical protein